MIKLDVISENNLVFTNTNTSREIQVSRDSNNVIKIVENERNYKFDFVNSLGENRLHQFIFKFANHDFKTKERIINRINKLWSYEDVWES